MRTIMLRFAGDCRKCGATLPEGDHAVYEKRVGIFCPACAPTDPEEIRAYRQEAADKKADKYETWAENREQKSNAVLNHIRDRYRGDSAFNTQPGHIPERARAIRKEDKALESLNIAKGFRAKAQGLRHVRVAGDAERKREASRSKCREWLQVGMTVHSPLYGNGEVLKINKKTASVKFGRYIIKEGLHHLRPIETPQ